MFNNLAGERARSNVAVPSIITFTIYPPAEAIASAIAGRQFSIYNAFMSDTSETFFTSVGCMDGRVQDPVADFGREKFNVQFADTITEAGLVGKLSKEPIEQNLLESLKSKILISLEKHHSKGIIVHGHEECAASDAGDEDTHKQNIINAANIIKTIANVPVIAVYIKKDNGEWTVEELSSTVLV